MNDQLKSTAVTDLRPGDINDQRALADPQPFGEEGDPKYYTGEYNLGISWFPKQPCNWQIKGDKEIQAKKEALHKDAKDRA